MRRRISLFAAALCLFVSWQFSGAVQLPAECSQSQSTIALIDCLQSQKDIQKQLLEYLELKSKISELQFNFQDHFTPASVTSEQIVDSVPHTDPVIELVNWFDQQMVVYAIVGKTNSLTAYVRLDGREYRIQKGDAIRLAKVIEVHPRQVVLSISGHELVIGLAGRAANAQVHSE